ncbi:uncharacterized protein MONBRDRAFT_28702 [Monosiga brevicollis MX1]|uniref:SH2 domain-containing protein n=1 Tax=Monosiga brevicollis TaxID=81824 RepID=A9V8Y2_MONBE|nr:uncharacterized protein MONBRDRAFT_28702 [Monosiga brevicollis MX1]EDQ85955.1 predicted protein [Monosiga brevicollis MX1]|eukprot:XP_001749149.1 hypothetical protein [Monosiga brevicollis MX1]
MRSHSCVLAMAIALAVAVQHVSAFKYTEQEPEVGSSAGLAIGLGLGLVLTVLLAVLCAGKKPKDQPQVLQSVAVSAPAVESGRISMSKVSTNMDVEDKPQTDFDHMDEDAIINARMDAKTATMAGAGSGMAAAMSLSASSQPWLHHATRRKEAEDLLREEALRAQESGIFLVRAKKEDQGQYALDVAWLDESSGQAVVGHHLIARSSNGTFELDEQAYEHCPSLESLIEYMMKSNNKFFHKALTRYIPAPQGDNNQSSTRRGDIQSAA